MLVISSAGPPRLPASGEYEDLIEACVIDPHQWARFALQNAASVASLMLTIVATSARTVEARM